MSRYPRCEITCSPHDPAPAVSRRGFLDRVLALLLTPGLTACGDGGTGPDETAEPARLTARPGVPTLSPTKGETSLGLGVVRDGILYVPESYTSDVSMPLFVALHGAGGEGKDWASYFARSEARGFIFLAPDSRGRTWDRVRFDFGDDVRFLDDALEYTFQRCRVDPQRIVLGGFSDGASYTLSLGVSNGDLFTHLVAYSPGFFKPDDERVGKPPIFISHGRSDSILPYTWTQNELVPKLQGEGYQVTFHPFNGDHQVPAAVSEAALDWCFGEAPAP